MVSLFSNSLKIKEITDKDNSLRSAFTFPDLPLQMGTALSNLLRQVLLNHLSGIAPLAVEISDQNGPVKTGFSVLSGVSEGGIAAYLILNLKEIIWGEKKTFSGLVCYQLEVENNSKSKKERTVTASDFQVGPEVEIKNPELKLAVLSPGGKLNIKLYCQKSWGYHQNKERSEQERVKKLIKDHFPEVKDNVIVLDPDYSPLKGGQVSFQIEKDLLQKREKLTLTIQSKGEITPAEALSEVLVITNSLWAKITEQIGKKPKTKNSAKKASKTEIETE